MKPSTRIFAVFVSYLFCLAVFAQTVTPQGPTLTSPPSTGSGSGSGTVNAGTAPQVAYYATTSTTVSPNPALQFPATESVFNESGADIDTRIEGDTNASLGFFDAGFDAVGIGGAPVATSLLRLQFDPNLARPSEFRLSRAAGTAGEVNEWTATISHPNANVATGSLLFRVAQTAPTGSAADIGFTTSSATAGLDPDVIIKASGRFGIGTALPQTQLHIVGSTGIRIEETGTARSFNIIPPTLGAIGSMLGNSGNGVVFGTTADAPMNLQQNSIDRMMFTSAGVVVNETGADFDTRMESDTDANMFFLDASTDRIGIKNGAPSVELDVTGTTKSTLFRAGGGTEFTSAGYGFSGCAGCGIFYNGSATMTLGTTSTVNTVIQSGNVGIASTIAGGDVVLVSIDVLDMSSTNNAALSAGGSISLTGTKVQLAGNTPIVGALKTDTSAVSGYFGMYGSDNNTPGAKPTCTAKTDAAYGSIIYWNDANDAIDGQLCMCNATSAAEAVAWRLVSAPAVACP